MRKLFGIVFVLTFCVTVSQAQQKWDVFGGYSFSRASVANEPGVFPMILNGAQAAATYNFNKHIGATGEFAGYHHDVDNVTINTQGYLFGPTGRIGFKKDKVSLFGDQLFGVTRFSFSAGAGSGCTTDCSPSFHSFTMVSGGGVDVRLNKHFSLRPVQMEYFLQRVSFNSIEVFAVSRPGPISNAPAPNNIDPGIYFVSDGFRFSTGAVYHF
jgi:hypothetical protein